MTATAVSISSEYVDRVTQFGFAVVEEVLSSDHVRQLRAALEEIPAGEEVRRKTQVYGIRNLLEVCPAVCELALEPALRALVEPVLGRKCFAVRATYFDKVPGANWNLQWHQDCAISVRQQIETPGFHAWSEKAGVLQVRPPESVLAEMLAVRVHLDDCHCENGALRLLAGSHGKQWLAEEISACRSLFEEHTCEVGAGGVLAMRPLTLHGSSASESAEHRRVIHLEFANQPLPNGLEWNNRVAPG